MSCRDPSEVLRTVLSMNRPELADRAQAVISSHGLAPAMVAQIVAEECLKLWRTLDKDGGQCAIGKVGILAVFPQLNNDVTLILVVSIVTTIFLCHYIQSKQKCIMFQRRETIFCNLPSCVLTQPWWG